MPGFLDFMGRMIEGKPVFDDENAKKAEQDQPHIPDETPAAPPSPAEPAGPVIRKGDENSFPVVYIKRVSPRIDGTKMQLYAWIKNDWPEEIMLDKIRMLNGTRELDSFLKGHEEREFLIYDGPRPQNQYHEAQLYYKTQHEGDYFEAIHDVTFIYHPEDKTYTVNEMRLRRPIRDIYG